MELRHLHPHLPILAALLTDQPGGELIHDHQISGGVNYFINSFCVWNCFIMARMVSKYMWRDTANVSLFSVMGLNMNKLCSGLLWY